MYHPAKVGEYLYQFCVVEVIDWSLNRHVMQATLDVDTNKITSHVSFFITTSVVVGCGFPQSTQVAPNYSPSPRCMVFTLTRP